MSSRRRSARTLILAALTAVAMFAALELLVRAFGMGVPPPGSRGLSTQAPYLAPDPTVPGRWRTRYDLPSGGEQVIPPKGDARRIAVVGSSSAVGLAFGDLSGQLAAVAGEGRYEVVYLGRPGYSSERISLLAAEVIEHLEPDLLFVYMGDAELAEALGPDERKEALRRQRKQRGVVSSAGDEPRSAFDDLVQLSRQSRLVRLITGTLAGRSGGLPEQWIPRPPDHDREMTPQSAEVLFEALTRNLESICRAAARRDIQVVLSTVVYNRFSAPFGTAYPTDLNENSRATFAELRGSALANLPEFLEPLLPEAPSDRVLPNSWRMESDALRSPNLEAQLPGRRRCFGKLAEADPEFLPREGWGPDVWELYQCLERVHAPALSPAEQRALEQAETSLQQALAICPDHPRALFELGLVSLLLQRDPAVVRRLLEVAASGDRAPRKASERLNELIREMAATEPGVLLFDADALFAARMPGGLVGWEWMLDQCHLQIGARRVLMGDLAEFVLEHGL